MNSAARAPGGHEVLLLVLRYLADVSDRLSRSFLRDELAPRFESDAAKETTMTLAEELRAEGREMGQRTLLQKLLQRRFGPLPAAVVEKIEQAPSPQLEEWGLRLLDAGSLDDALAE